MKSSLWKLMISIAILSLLITACGSAATATPAATQAPAKGEGEVDIVDWPGYIERGANEAGTESSWWTSLLKRK